MALVHALLSGALAAMLLVQAGPPIVSDSIATLTCKVVKEEPGKLNSTRLWIEVANSSAFAAEPLTFKVRHEPRNAKAGQVPFVVSVSRVQFPFADRLGRPVAAGGKLRYWLQVASYVSGEGTWSVKVERASWHKRAGVAKPGVKIGVISQVQQKDGQGQELSVSRVKLTNASPNPIDTVYLATVSQPRDGQVLLGARVPPGEFDWVISELPQTLGFEQSTPTNAVRVDKLELMDWCFVGGGDPAAAAAAFEPAYANWLRWKKPFPSLTGRFAFSLQASGGIEFAGEGTFRADPQGAVDVKLEPVPGKSLDTTGSADLRTNAVKVIAGAFVDLRRADTKEVLDQNRPRLVAEGVIELGGDGFAEAGMESERARWLKTNPQLTPNFTLREGRIAGGGDRTGFDLWAWKTQDLDSGYVVTERRSVKGDWRYQWSYVFADGIPVPTAYRQYWGTVTGALLSQSQVYLTDVRVDASADPIKFFSPEGPGAAALQQAWENGYRYGGAPRDLTAKFEVRNPGTDGVWQGHRKLDGTVKLMGFRGFRFASQGWSGFEAHVSTPLSAEQRRALGFVFYDRLILWAGRDFSGRGEFATTFAGAKIHAANPEGEIRIDAGPYRSVTVKEGRIASLTTAQGTVRRHTWSKVGDRWVVTRVQTGDEDLTVKFTPVGDALIPVEMDFRAVFGKDWGPESLRLGDVKLE